MAKKAKLPAPQQGPVPAEKVGEHLAKWARGETTLRAIKGYSEEQLHAIATIAYYFLMQGKNDDARTLFEGLVAVEPGNAYYYRALGVICHRAGDDSRAIKQFSYAIKVDPRSPRAYVNRGEIYLSKQQRQRAADDFKRALHLSAGNDPRTERKARALLRVSVGQGPVSRP